MTRISSVDRRSALVHAALRVVADRGVAQATTRAIVAEAGMSLASFHYAFASRDELMTELVTHVVRAEAGAVLPEPAGPATADPAIAGPAAALPALRQTLRDGLARYAAHLRADPLREKAMLELTQYALRSTGMRSLAQEQYRRYHALAAVALDRAAEQSGCLWLRPVDEVARLLVALADGFTVAWLVDRDDAAAETLLDLTADAVAALGRPA
jgi:AcrR family transcriptional regulator